jgi:predicted aspartyl protease
MFKPLFTALVFLMGFVIVSTADAATVSDFVALKIDGTGAVVVPVTINGQGPFSFLLDTGSNRSAVSSDLASRLGLPVVAKTIMVTSTGTEPQLVVAFDRMAVGSVETAGLLASLIPAGQLKSAIPGVDGIVGQDFLSASDYTLDYQKKRLSWTAADPRADGRDVRLSLVKEEGRFLVELPQNHGALRFVPDSGAAGFVIFQHGGPASISLEEMGQGVTQFTVSGSQETRLMMMRQLQVGDVSVKNQPAVVIQRTEPGAPEGDGLMPLHLFASVSFNCKEGYFVARGR